MATRTLGIAKRGAPRAVYAAALLAVLVGALLGAWFLSGWHDVRMRQREVRDAPSRAASQRAEQLARDLHGELENLIARETRRPYFHYQNLMHDPKASLGMSVSPSPLAQAPEDKLVAGYFQIDGNGRASTPTINDDVPELSESGNLAGNRAFRDQVVRDLVRDLAPPKVVAESAVLVAEAPRQQVVPPQQGAQEVIQIDANSYAQNITANAVYWQQWDNNMNASPQGGSTTGNDGGTKKDPPKNPPQKIVAPPPGTTSAVTVTVSPLEWRTLTFGGVASLLAVRQVQTPDGNLAQGFVVDRATLTSRLAGKAGEMVAELRTGSQIVAGTAASVDIAPGWHLSVVPNPRTIARAARDAASVARDFLVRFIGIGTIAIVVAGCVLWIVMRAERLARERSQFAAAAAHELRTPLAGLQLYGDMLADGLGDPGKMKDYARRMSEEAARLGRVVSNVLGFSQLERGNLSVDPQVGSLGEALCELAERAEPALDRAGAVLELDVAPDLRARFDRDALARIVGNLLDNAEKYTRGADDRTIRLAAIDKGDAVEVIVADRGPGVTRGARLFQPFSRGVANDGPAGLGLGLALSQSLARAMGGELAHRDADGGGAAFTLRLSRA
ncbi:MAG: HAMP domain-containing histidine kinase [Kofleriaceae bacterium]|nr:HAMP domain-containing histidine kinase [Kofleriaceae bacterium]